MYKETKGWVSDILVQLQECPHVNSPPTGTKWPQTCLSEYTSSRLLLSWQLKSAHRVNKLVIITFALQQAMCTFYINPSFRGFLMLWDPRGSAADCSCPSNRTTTTKTCKVNYLWSGFKFKNTADIGQKDFTPFPFKWPVFHVCEKPRQDHTKKTNGRALR